MKPLIRKLRKLLNNGIIDIIIFGSRAKGKTVPGDIDLAVLVKEKKAGIKESFLKEVPDADIQVVGIEDILTGIFLTLLKEGFSVRKDSYIHNLYGLKPVKLYKYSLKHLTASKKVMFERGIKQVEGITKLSNRVVMVPIEKTGEFDDFLRRWDLDIDAVDYELLPILRKEEIM